MAGYSDLRRADREYARGKTRAAFRFWKTDDNNRAALRDLIKISQQLDLVVIRTQNIRFQRGVVLRSGYARIGIGRLVPGRRDFAFSKKIF